MKDSIFIGDKEKYSSKANIINAEFHQAIYSVLIKYKENCKLRELEMLAHDAVTDAFLSERL